MLKTPPTSRMFRTLATLFVLLAPIAWLHQEVPFGTSVYRDRNSSPAPVVTSQSAPTNLVVFTQVRMDGRSRASR